QVSFGFGPMEDYQKDIFIDQLAEIGFDSFEEIPDGLHAFVLVQQFREQKLKDLLAEQPFVQQYEITNIAPQNWNEAWEKNFSPLKISEECYVRATFHEPQPQYPYEIVI